MNIYARKMYHSICAQDCWFISSGFLNAHEYGTQVKACKWLMLSSLRAPKIFHKIQQKISTSNITLTIFSFKLRSSMSLSILGYYFKRGVMWGKLELDLSFLIVLYYSVSRSHRIFIDKIYNLIIYLLHRKRISIIFLTLWLIESGNAACIGTALREHLKDSYCSWRYHLSSYYLFAILSSVFSYLEQK